MIIVSKHHMFALFLIDNVNRDVFVPGDMVKRIFNGSFGLVVAVDDNICTVLWSNMGTSVADSTLCGVKNIRSSAPV